MAARMVGVVRLVLAGIRSADLVPGGCGRWSLDSSRYDERLVR